MQIKDCAAFLRHTKILTIALNNGKKKNFEIDYNIKTGNYFNIVCIMDSLKAAENDNERIFLLAEIVNEILQNTKQKITTHWIIENISPENQMEIVNSVFGFIDKALSDDCFRIPEFDYKKDTASNKAAKAREEKKIEIQRLQNTLKSKNEITLMEEIAAIMKETANTYWDIMRMPILIFRDISKTITLINARSDDDYNLAYLKSEVRKYKDELNNKVIMEPQKPRGADLKGLKALLSK